MNDEQFESALRMLKDEGYPPLAHELRARDTAQRKEIAELRVALANQPAAIKLPERRPIDQKDNFRRGCAHGFNACLIAVSRLNAVRGAEQ